MVAAPFRRPLSKPRRTGPLRFVLAHLGSPAPAEDVKLIEAAPGLTIESRSDNVLLVSGPPNLRALKRALPSLQTRWIFDNEVFHQLMGS